MPGPNMATSAPKALEGPFLPSDEGFGRRSAWAVDIPEHRHRLHGRHMAGSALRPKFGLLHRDDRWRTKGMRVVSRVMAANQGQGAFNVRRACLGCHGEGRAAVRGIERHRRMQCHCGKGEQDANPAQSRPCHSAPSLPCCDFGASCHSLPFLRLMPKAKSCRFDVSQGGGVRQSLEALPLNWSTAMFREWRTRDGDRSDDFIGAFSGRNEPPLHQQIGVGAVSGQAPLPSHLAKSRPGGRRDA